MLTQEELLRISDPNYQRFGFTAPTIPSQDITLISSKEGEKLAIKDLEFLSLTENNLQEAEVQRKEEEAKKTEEAKAVADKKAEMEALGAGVASGEGSNADGVKGQWITNPDTGINQFFPEGSTISFKKTGENLANDGLDKEYETLKNQLNALKTSQDAITNALIDSINSKYAGLIQQQKEINKAVFARTQTASIRFGSARYAPEITSGILSEEESIGLRKIEALESEKLSLISKAKQAKQDMDYKLLNESIEMYETKRKEQKEALIKQQELALKKAEDLRQKKELELKQLKEDREAKESLVKSLGYYALNAIGGTFGDEDSDSEIIKGIASDYTITDPNILLNEVIRLQTEKVKYPAGSVGEYLFYRGQALDSGMQENKIMSFDDWLQRQATRKPQAGDIITKQEKLSAQQSLRKEFNQLPVVKDFNEIRRGYTLAKSGYNEILSKVNENFESLAPAHQAIIIAFNKMLDPGSVVREGEYARTTEGQSLVNRFYGKLDQYIRGGAGITSGDIKSIVDVVDRIYNDYIGLYNETVNEYRSYASEYGANPDYIAKPLETKSGELDEFLDNEGL